VTYCQAGFHKNVFCRVLLWPQCVVTGVEPAVVLGAPSRPVDSWFLGLLFLTLRHQRTLVAIYGSAWHFISNCSVGAFRPTNLTGFAMAPAAIDRNHAASVVGDGRLGKYGGRPEPGLWTQKSRGGREGITRAVLSGCQCKRQSSRGVIDVLGPVPGVDVMAKRSQPGGGG
jgi:hypothetical protein